MRGRTFGLAMAVIAALSLLGGGAFAASHFVITSKSQIKPSVLRQLKGNRGRQGPRGAQGLRGPQGLKGDTGAQGNPGQAGQPGTPGRSALSVLQSGEVVHGAWALAGDATASSQPLAGVTLPIPAPQPIDSAHVVVAGNDDMSGDGCSGSSTAPVAAPGFVCIYFATATGTSVAAGFGARGDLGNGFTATGDGSPFGFVIRVGGAAGFAADGTWAYTAP